MKRTGTRRKLNQLERKDIGQTDTAANIHEYMMARTLLPHVHRLVGSRQPVGRG